MIILGVDPGIADTGVGAIKKDQNNNLSCLGYDSIVTGVDLTMPERLELLSSELQKMIDEYQPNLIAVEKLFFCKNVKTALVVGQARGVVLLTARQNRVHLEEYTPLQVKQAVSTYGRASKLQVQKMVKLLLKLDHLPRPDDAADALAVAICAGNSFRER